MSIEHTPEDIDRFNADMARIAESNLVDEAGYILSGSTMKIATVDHVLALRNVIAGAYRLLDKVQKNEPVSDADIRAWQRRSNPILDARVAARR